MPMTVDGLNASTAAVGVDYESASQFGRELTCSFGNSLADEAARMRAMVSLLPNPVIRKERTGYA
jgi:hypothetical protein